MPDRMVAAHERDRDADETRPAREVEEQPMVHAHDLVQAHQSGERARDRHGHDHGPRGPDAAVDVAAVSLWPRARSSYPQRVCQR